MISANCTEGGFAESAPKRKLVLLHEVQKAICDWLAGAYRKDNEHGVGTQAPAGGLLMARGCSEAK
ncbi:MAG: hypothetical protein DMG70_23990 [Acidobacteria bacterium]|nr:MAG: hypothetical protein DMG70_23990 [Acidobacteriota bacterium]